MPAMSSFPEDAVALVVGASRGIGLEMVRQLAASGRFRRIHATTRQPHASAGLGELVKASETEISVTALDVTDESAIERWAGLVTEVDTHVHLVIYVAGVLHDREWGLRPEKRLEELDPEALVRGFRINAVGPALIAKHIHRLLGHGDKAVIANLSARVGSIEDNRLGGWYGYRASKAAQNMLTRDMAIELGRRAPNCCCLALHPGTTDTELSKPFQARVPEGKLFTPAFSVEHLLAIIDRAGPGDSGHFYGWDGAEIPW